MAPLWVTDYLQLIMGYVFHDVQLLEKALVAGDSNSHDTEGHRGLAQLGDAVMGMIILCEGLKNGTSRKEQQYASSHLRSKQFCNDKARQWNLHLLVKVSERQCHIGPQATTLKNVIVALIGATWLDAKVYDTVLHVMKGLQLIEDDPLGQRMVQAESFAGCCPSLDDTAPCMPVPSFSCDFRLNYSQDSSLMLSPLDSIRSTASDFSMRDYTPDTSFDACAVMQDSTVPEALTTTAFHNCDSDKSSTSQQRRCFDKGSARLARLSKRPRDGSYAVISTYLALERERSVGDMYARTAAILNNYHATIQQAPETSHRSLAILATSIGDNPALLQLQEAMLGFRNRDINDCLSVTQTMSIDERIDAIQRLGSSTAYLQLMRRLHVATLYEELSREMYAEDDFVVITPKSVTQAVRHGNPRNLVQTDLAHRLSEGQAFGGCPVKHSSHLYRKRLRRIGQRLNMMVKKWGYGALLLLGPRCTEDILVKSPERSFFRLIEVIDKWEGSHIHAISLAALPVLQAFRENLPISSCVSLEVTSRDNITKIPRLCFDLQALFQPINEPTVLLPPSFPPLEDLVHCEDM